MPTLNDELLEIAKRMAINLGIPEEIAVRKMFASVGILEEMEKEMIQNDKSIILKKVNFGEGGTECSLYSLQS
jgi:hypothetical protein